MLIHLINDEAMDEEDIFGKEEYRPDKVKQIRDYFDQGTVKSDSFNLKMMRLFQLTIFRI